MSKYVFEDSTIHTLHQYSKILFEVFSKADRQIVESHNDWNNSNELDFKVNPHRYYSYRAGSIQMEIINKQTKVGNPCFSFFVQALFHLILSLTMSLSK